MIFKGEIINRKREVLFDLQDAGNNPIVGFNWLAAGGGALHLRTPGGVLGNADVTRVVEIGGGTYAYQLDDADVALAGSGIVRPDAALTGAQALDYPFDVVDAADFATSSSGGGGGGGLPAGPVTITDLEDIVRTRGNYLSSLAFKSVYVRREIQAGFRELYELIANTHEGYWDKYSTVATVAAQDYIGLPVDCWRVQGVDVDVGGEWCQLRQTGIKNRNRYGTTRGRPAEFRLSARGLELQPIPDGIYTLRVLYTPIVPTLDDNGIQLYGWEEYVIESALVRLGEREERDFSDHYRRLYDPENGIKAQIIRAASERKSSEPEYLPIGGSYGGDEDYL